MTYDKNSTDDALREGCLAGNRSAQEHLYRRYFGRLMPIPLRYLGDRTEAADVLNQAFLKIFNALGQYAQSGSFSGWMASIVLHTTIDFVRRRNAYRKNLVFETVHDVPIQNTALDQMATEDAPFSFVVPPASFADVDVGDSLGYTATLSSGATSK